MTERDKGEDPDYSDGSVGRYVRDVWGPVPTHAPRAARPYVQPIEQPPSPRTAPDVESDPAEDDVWAYQPDPAPAAAHDPFKGVEYGSATWAARAAEHVGPSTADGESAERAGRAPKSPRGGRGRAGKRADSTGAHPAVAASGGPAEPADPHRASLVDRRSADDPVSEPVRRRGHGADDSATEARRDLRGADVARGAEPRRDHHGADDPAAAPRRDPGGPDDFVSGPLPRRDDHGARGRASGPIPGRDVPDPSAGAGPRRDVADVPDPRTGPDPRDPRAAD